MSSKPEKRQHVSLSQYAYNAICQDSIDFIGKINISGFICKIINNTRPESFESWALIEEERIIKELEASKARLTSDNMEVVSAIADAHMRKRISAFKKHPKDIGFKIRLNIEAREFLYPDPDFNSWDGTKYGLSQNEYISAVIEEYARKTYYERESIYYKDEIDLLTKNLAVEASENKILTLVMKDNKKLHCKLYRLSEEYEAHYHYLIGKTSELNRSEYKIASIRLSRIAKIAKTSSSSAGHLKKAEIKSIESKIEKCGVQYLLGEPAEYTVKLTTMGMILYNYIYSQRPIYSKLTEEDNISSENNSECYKYTLIITATERQIKNYFFAFGKEALVLSNNETTNWMKEKYASASEAYNKL